MGCSEFISYLVSHEVPIGVIVNIVLASVNIGVLWFIYRQFKRQGEQIESQKDQFNLQFTKQVEQLEEQKRQFSDRSFQDAFFGLFSFLNEEKEHFSYSEDLSDTEAAEKEYQSIKTRSLYVQLRDQYREHKLSNTAIFIVELQHHQPGIKDPMPLTKNILLLIHKNLKDESISKDSALYYASLVASKLNYFTIREYRLYCVRSYVKSRSRKDYNIAEGLEIFKILEESHNIPVIDKFDESIEADIKHIMEGQTPF